MADDDWAKAVEDQEGSLLTKQVNPPGGLLSEVLCMVREVRGGSGLSSGSAQDEHSLVDLS